MAAAFLIFAAMLIPALWTTELGGVFFVAGLGPRWSASEHCEAHTWRSTHMKS
ncbi:MAG TPA: hypothetical protein VK988_21930 [Acidimicrobiales bacterium]|nr:hypothetical protein [Acidimicrobiales bacterium]